MCFVAFDYAHLSLFQLHMQIISEHFTPVAVLDQWKIWAVLIFQSYILSTMQQSFRARIRDSKQFQLSLNPPYPQIFYCCLHIMTVSALHTSPSIPNTKIFYHKQRVTCVHNTDPIYPERGTLFSHNAGV
jgi:hypothetical protein